MTSYILCKHYKQIEQLCCRLELARSVLETAHKQWPSDVICRGYLGLTLKLQGHHKLAVPHLLASVKSDQPETINSRFYFHLGDGLQRLNRNDEAMEIYEKGVIKGIFRSKYQRSLYNVDRLKAKPWWTLEESTYSSFFRKCFRDAAHYATPPPVSAITTHSKSRAQLKSSNCIYE
ncbi:hypothetical protein J6590_053604 [Homalodisca vitripennis]|nr:hypothetical protein J6590_053604 [Homalodisca vitripennis]